MADGYIIRSLIERRYPESKVNLQESMTNSARLSLKLVWRTQVYSDDDDVIMGLVLVEISTKFSCSSADWF